MNQTSKINQNNPEQINPYKIFEMSSKNLFKKKLFHKAFSSPSSTIIKNSLYLTPIITKKMKQITLSNHKYKKYISSYDKITMESCFKTPNNTLYPKRKNPQFMSLSCIKRKPITNKKIRNSNAPLYSNNKSSFNNHTNFENQMLKNFSNDNIKLNISINKEENLDSNIEEANIEETSYGFKYKDTKIITNIKKYKEKIDFRKLRMKDYKLVPNFWKKQSKDYQKKDSTFFSSFINGNFFDNNKRKKMNGFNKGFSRYEGFDDNKEEFKNYDLNYSNNENKDYFMKKEQNILFLFDEMKSIGNDLNNNNDINDIYNKKVDINMKSPKANYNFLLEIKSICLKFTEFNPKENFKKMEKQKIYLPFKYLPLFYILDFVSFKCFLSELLTYDNTNNKFVIKEKEKKNIINKYIEIAENYYKNYLSIKEKNDLKIFNGITYNLNENKYQLCYDWCIYTKEKGGNYDKKIYKMNIILPTVKFNLNKERIKIRKKINKNLIVEFIRNNFSNWKKHILFELFILRKFRIIINHIFTKKFYLYSNKKIYVDNTYIPSNLSNNKYDFFITNLNTNITKYFSFIPKIVILSYKINPQFIKTDYFLLSIKDINNIKKLSKYLDIYNIIIKCICINKHKNHVSLNMNLIDNVSTDFMESINNEKNLKEIEIKDDHNENKIFTYKSNDFDINILLRKSKIINISFDKDIIELLYYDIPELLLEDILKNNNNNHIESIYNCMEEIILNSENNMGDKNREILYINGDEVLSKKELTKSLFRKTTKTNKEMNNILLGKMSKKQKLSYAYSKNLSQSTKNIKDKNTYIFNKKSFK